MRWWGAKVSAPALQSECLCKGRAEGPRGGSEGGGCPAPLPPQRAWRDYKSQHALLRPRPARAQGACAARRGSSRRRSGSGSGSRSGEGHGSGGARRWRRAAAARPARESGPLVRARGWGGGGGSWCWHCSPARRQLQLCNLHPPPLRCPCGGDGAQGRGRPPLAFLLQAGKSLILLFYFIFFIPSLLHPPLVLPPQNVHSATGERVFPSVEASTLQQEGRDPRIDTSPSPPARSSSLN